jgi:BlaI family penicillinase repressor
MKVIWGRPPQTASEIIGSLDDEGWHPNTIKTLLSRLQRRGAVGVDKRKALYRYYASASEADCVQRESQSFLERVFDGAVKPLLVHFVQKHRLSSDDIDELREILRKKRR